MKNTTKRVLSILTERGYRITHVRKEIVSLLANAAHPLTVQGVVECAQADEASVYRTISLLLHEGLLETIYLSGDQPSYALTFEHHHHTVCTECGYTQHLPCTDLSTPRTPDGFAMLTHHEVTHYGLCTKCT